MKENKISRRSFLKFGAAASAVGMMAAAPVAANAAQPDADAAADEENCLLGLFQKPKYIFLFIGDGMGTAQIQSARFYKGTVDNNGAVTEADLSFTSFPTVGSVTTYDSTSFCPDSASTATSIATGHKTESGVINMCPWTRDVPYETIAEKLHAQKNYKVGVVSSVNIDHATPAAPGAGAVILFTILSGAGFVNDSALLAYSLILAINRPIEMLVTSLNVVGDAVASICVAKSEGLLNEEKFNA